MIKLYCCSPLPFAFFVYWHLILVTPGGSANKQISKGGRRLKLDGGADGGRHSCGARISAKVAGELHKVQKFSEDESTQLQFGKTGWTLSRFYLTLTEH
jgi:hypothetical protein